MSKRNTLVGPQLQRGRMDFHPDWKRLIAFVAVIVLGSIVATQVLANSYRFILLWSLTCSTSIRPGLILCGRTNGSRRIIIPFSPKLSASARWSHSAVSSF